jgi:flagellar protein FliO/FliZ
VTGLLIRLAFSLLAVIGLLLLLARLANRRFSGRTGSMIQVLHRQALSKGAGVAVISVGERVLLVGTTEHEVRLIAELSPEELDLEVVLRQHVADEISRGDGPPAGIETPQGPLAGSVLSPQTWRQAWKAVTK